MLPEARRPLLKQLLGKPRLLRAIECHSPISAVLGATAAARVDGQDVEFDVLWASGFSHATALALPDAELATLERRLDAIAAIASVTSKPILADGDTGGDAMAFGLLCRRLEDLGVGGVVLEDKAGAKRTSLADDAQHELEDPETVCWKISSARDRLLSDDFLIFARIESLIAGAGMADALRRAERYLRSDADGLVIHSKDATGGEVLRFMEGYRRLQQQTGSSKPLVCIPTAYNHLTGAELYKHGARLVIHANHMIRAAYRSMQQAAQLILKHDRSAEADAVCAPVKELFDAVGVETTAPKPPARIARVNTA